MDADGPKAQKQKAQGKRAASAALGKRPNTHKLQRSETRPPFPLSKLSLWRPSPLTLAPPREIHAAMIAVADAIAKMQTLSAERAARVVSLIEDLRAFRSRCRRGSRKEARKYHLFFQREAAPAI